LTEKCKGKPMYQRILAAVDGSETSHHALREALQFAKEVNAELHLVHVVDVTPGFESGLDAETFRQIARQEATEVLDEVVLLARQTRANAQTVMLEAGRKKTRKAIVNEAKRWGADLIVMGTHGRTGIARLVLGSVAEGVVHTAPVPVLLIRY